jgi:membrane-associated protease RseP (regulator of RpoE activity)
VLRFNVPPACAPPASDTAKTIRGSLTATPDSALFNRVELQTKQLSGLVYSFKMSRSGDSSTSAAKTLAAASQPVFVIDGVVMEQLSAPPSTGYGFAFSCDHGCTKVTNPDGTTFYRFPAAPTISDIRAESPAAKAGFKVGDVVMKIDGVSILDDEAAARLTNAGRRPLQITVLRDGREIGLQLQSPK